jgi:hypothetical protein
MPDDKDWIGEFVRRQDNIDPIRRIPNGALFQGRLIKGDLRLNCVQRVGAVIIGFCFLAIGCMGLAEIVSAVRRWSLAEISTITILGPLWLWFGLRIIMNAFMNDRGRRNRKAA